MLNDKSMFTPTMAKVLEDQGYYEEAVQIYAHLLDRMPGHTAYRDKVAELRQILETASDEGDRLTDLFDEWLFLASEYRKLKRLQELRGELSRHGKEKTDQWGE